MVHAFLFMAVLFCSARQADATPKYVFTPSLAYAIDMTPRGFALG